MRTFINTVGIILFLVVLLTFATKNTQPVELSYYNDIRCAFPAWTLVVIPFFIGVVMGNLLDVIQRFRLKNEVRKLKKGANTPSPQSKTRTDFPGVYKLSFTVDDIVEKNGMKSPYGVNLLVMGTVKSAGGGCACSANAVIRELLRHLIVERDEIVVVDMEAGVEHMGRGTASQVDIMLIVADSSRKSLEIAKKLSGLAHEAGIRNVFVVGNRVRDSEEKELIMDFTQKNALPLLNLIPYDDTVMKADRVGEAPMKYKDTSKGVKAIQVLGEKLLQSKYDSRMY